MKKLLSISLIVIISFIAFSFTTVKANTDKPVEKKSIELTVDEEDLYCKVTIGENTVSCWFCDCSDLALTLAALE